MHEILRNQFSAAEAPKCEKGDCRLPLDRLRWPVFILDCDRYCGLRGLQGKICDFFVFLCRSTLTVAVVEMKSGRDVTAIKAVEQIRAGAAELDRIIGTQTVSLYPILLHSGIKHANELKVLRDRKVTYRGAEYGIIYKRCGTHLLEIIEQFH
jgi:hypothetical protein